MNDPTPWQLLELSPEKVMQTAQDLRQHLSGVTTPDGNMTPNDQYTMHVISTLVACGDYIQRLENTIAKLAEDFQEESDSAGPDSVH